MDWKSVSIKVLAGREGRHFLYGTPALPIIYFWRGGYLPVSIEITELRLLRGKKGIPLRKITTTGPEISRGGDTTRIRMV